MEAAIFFLNYFAAIKVSRRPRNKMVSAIRLFELSKKDASPGSNWRMYAKYLRKSKFQLLSNHLHVVQNEMGKFIAVLDQTSIFKICWFYGHFKIAGFFVHLFLVSFRVIQRFSIYLHPTLYMSFFVVHNIVKNTLYLRICLKSAPTETTNVHKLFYQWNSKRLAHISATTSIRIGIPSLQYGWQLWYAIYKILYVRQMLHILYCPTVDTHYMHNNHKLDIDWLSVHWVSWARQFGQIVAPTHTHLQEARTAIFHFLGFQIPEPVITQITSVGALNLSQNTPFSVEESNEYH